MSRLATLKTVYVELAFWAGAIGGTAALISTGLDAATSVAEGYRIGLSIVASVAGYLGPLFIRRAAQIDKE